MSAADIKVLRKRTGAGILSFLNTARQRMPIARKLSLRVGTEDQTATAHRVPRESVVAICTTEVPAPPASRSPLWPMRTDPCSPHARPTRVACRAERGGATDPNAVLTDPCG